MFKHCTPADVGLGFKAGAPKELRDTLSSYFYQFIKAEHYVHPKYPGTACICGRKLSGYGGTYTHSLQDGEGRCSECGHPARARHLITLDGDVVAGIKYLPLSYHPDALKESANASNTAAL